MHGNREAREFPGIQELEWENPDEKNLLVCWVAPSLDTSEEHETRAQIPGGVGKEQIAIQYAHLTMFHVVAESDNNIVRET